MSYTADSFLGEMLEGNFPMITVEVHTTISGSIAMGGQGMVRTAGIVAGTLTSILSKEYATCIHHFLRQFIIVNVSIFDMSPSAIELSVIGTAIEKSVFSSFEYPALSLLISTL